VRTKVKFQISTENYSHNYFYLKEHIWVCDRKETLHVAMAHCIYQHDKHYSSTIVSIYDLVVSC